MFNFKNVTFLLERTWVFQAFCKIAKKPQKKWLIQTMVQLIISLVGAVHS
jgi:hypothetical protein